MELHPHQHQPFFLCEETWEWDDETDHVEDPVKDPPFSSYSHHGNIYASSPPPPPAMLHQDLHWDPQELPSLISKQGQERGEGDPLRRGLDSSPWLLQVRNDAVEWIMKVHAFYSFSANTAVFAVDYLDRFLLSCFGTLEGKKPWMTQLTAVACLSLAAKVEETRVPLLLDFQVEESSPVFEAKTIQRMEVVVLSSLRWRMNPVTPLSFIDFAMRRFGFKDWGQCWAFRSRCEQLLLSVLPDCRTVGYLPSVLASAIMLHVLADLKLDIDVVGILGVDEGSGSVGQCYDFVSDSASWNNRRKKNKRKLGSSPGSPRGVMDVWCSSDSSNDSSGVSGLSSVSSSPEQAISTKRSRGCTAGEGQEEEDHLFGGIQ
ncbi:hypothetical protein MLD38_012964 [Melastoma candidum]|uniref:Uncharacterized protein n=1 Tax=Melastoma candidum TaxID=119954 RepID=A0ACB9RBP3_9MYRT|nr:hypothetical protein MLD38_012964 [Melastoma candidum]